LLANSIIDKSGAKNHIEKLKVFDNGNTRTNSLYFLYTRPGPDNAKRIHPFATVEADEVPDNYGHDTENSSSVSNIGLIYPQTCPYLPEQALPNSNSSQQYTPPPFIPPNGYISHYYLPSIYPPIPPPPPFPAVVSHIYPHYTTYDYHISYPPTPPPTPQPPSASISSSEYVYHQEKQQQPKEERCPIIINIENRSSDRSLRQRSKDILQRIKKEFK
jgi:hypothetical protein